MNIAIFSGRLTRDPELRTTATGNAVTTFTLAVDRISKDKQTDWIPVVVWGAQATNCDRFLTKGSKVNVKGRLQSRSYEDRNGNKRTTLEVNAEQVEFLDPRDARKHDQPQETPAYQEPQEDWETKTLQDIENGSVDPSDLPF